MAEESPEHGPTDQGDGEPVHEPSGDQLRRVPAPRPAAQPAAPAAGHVARRAPVGRA